MGSLPHFVECLMLIGATVAIHSTGTLGILWCLHRYRETAARHFGFTQNTAMLATLVILLILLHGLEASCWAAFYAAKHCFPEFRTALYFSLITFSTVGYGDVVLGEEWRLLGGVEALTGMMMVSWSTALLLGACTWISSRRMEAWGGRQAEERFGLEVTARRD